MKIIKLITKPITSDLGLVSLVVGVESPSVLKFVVQLLILEQFDVCSLAACGA